MNEQADRVTDSRRLEWFPIDNIVLDNFELTAMQIALYVAIVRFANRKTGEAWPGQDTLAERAGMGAKSVQRHVDALVEKGLIAVKKTPGKSHHYIVLDPRDAKPTPDTESTLDQTDDRPRSESPDTPVRESSLERSESPDTPVRESNEQESFNKNHHQQESKNKTSGVESSSSTTDDDDDKMMHQILDSVSDWQMLDPLAERLKSLGAVRALATIWHVQDATPDRPAGYLKRTLDAGYPVSDELLSQAAAAVENKTLDRPHSEDGETGSKYLQGEYAEFVLT